MSMFKVDKDTGELVREGNSFVRVDGTEEILQHNRIRLRMFRGECEFNLVLGMRYIGQASISEKGVPNERIESEFVDAILGTPGMVEVDRNLTVSAPDANRRATVTYTGTASIIDANERIPLHDTFTLETTQRT